MLARGKRGGKEKKLDSFGEENQPRKSPCPGRKEKSWDQEAERKRWGQKQGKYEKKKSGCKDVRNRRESRRTMKVRGWG